MVLICLDYYYLKARPGLRFEEELKPSVYTPNFDLFIFTLRYLIQEFNLRVMTYILKPPGCSKPLKPEQDLFVHYTETEK